MTNSFYNPQHTCTLPPRSAVTQARLPAPPLAAGIRLSCLLLYRWAPHLWQVHQLICNHPNQWRTLAKRLRQIVFVNVQRMRRSRALGVQGKKDVIWDHLHLLTWLQAVLITLKVKCRITIIHFVCLLFYTDLLLLGHLLFSMFKENI